MKNKFILGLILMSVLLMSVIGVSAQITGDVLGASCKTSGDCSGSEGCSSGGHCYEIKSSGGKAFSSTGAKSNPSSFEGANLAKKYKGWVGVSDAFGGTCYVPKPDKGKSFFKGQFLGKLFE